MVQGNVNEYEGGPMHCNSFILGVQCTHLPRMYTQYEENEVLHLIESESNLRFADKNRLYAFLNDIDIVSLLTIGPHHRYARLN